jgi:hypothetical protein
MLRGLKLAFAVAAVLATAGEARAQWGYGYPGGYGGYGWGGWGGGNTVQGSIAQGLGYYLMGAGQYNVQTAQANAINADTIARWNQYMYESQLTANRAERARLARRGARDSAAGAATEKRLREEPTEADILSGDALNAALDQISDPRVSSSSLRLATAKVPGTVVRDIPFVNASEAVSISLDQLTAEKGWPFALRAANFDEERKAYTDAVDKALEEDQKGEISPQTIQQMRSALSRLKTKFEAARPADPAQFGEAETYLKTLYGMTRMLERPDVDKLISEANSIKETTLGSLIGFMHNFNFRFGRATTGSQRAAYMMLYPLLAAHRNRVLADAGIDSAGKSTAKADNTPPPPPPGPGSGRPTDFFSGMHLNHLEGPHRLGEPAKPGK